MRVMTNKEIIEMFKNNKDEIVRLRQAGETYGVIGEKFGVSTTCIRNFCLDNHIKKGDKIGGQEIGNVKIIRRATKEENPWKSHETPYWVECLNCGHQWVGRKTDIMKKTIKCPECGDPGGRGHKLKMKGERFGYLTVISDTSFYKYNHNSVYLTCQCDCGKIVDVRYDHLKGRGNRSRTISCGCKSRSSGEVKIEQILEENNIDFKNQYIIEDFSQFAAFDFAIFNQGKLLGLIEYDGEQHFRPIDFFGGEEKFKIQQNNDLRKNVYCKEHDINLIRIPYTDFDKINIEYLLEKFPKLKNIV